MSIEPGKILLFDFFDQSYIYNIPSYQRDYKWGKQEIDNFSKDLIDFKKLFDTSNNYDLVYYFGGVITQKTPSGKPSESKADYYLIDGQQRFTTFVLFYKFIIDTEFELLDKKERDEFPLHKRYDEAFKKSSKTFKLQNKNNDLENFVYMKSSTISNFPKIYEENYAAISRKFSNEIKNLKDIEDWKNIMKNVLISTIGISINQNAEQIFENINSKGKKLSVLEMFKNKLLLTNNLLMKQSILEDQTKGQELEIENLEIEKRIVDIFDSISQFQNKNIEKNGIRKIQFQNENDLIRIISTNLFNREIKIDSMYEIIKFEIENKILTTDQLTFFITKLEKLHNDFKTVDAIMSHDTESAFYINWIQGKSLAFVSILIKFVSNLRSENKIDSSEIASAKDDKFVSDFKNIFNVLSKYSIFSDGLTGINSWREVPNFLDFSNVEELKILIEKQLKLDNADDEKNEEVKPTDSLIAVEEVDFDLDVEIDLQTIKTYEFYKRDKFLLKHLLLIIEKEKQILSGSTEHLDWKGLINYVNMKDWTIEHIIPQKINPTKPEGAIWTEELNGFDYMSNIDKIGNLTIIKHKLNSQMKNNSFANKKQDLQEKSNLILSKEICLFEKFNSESYEIRSNDLSQMILYILN